MFKQELNLKMPTFVWLMIVLLSCLSTTVRAEYTSVTVIGDSFSDGGSDKTAVVSYYKLFNRHFQDHLNPTTNQSYYFGNRFSNGHVAVEYLAYQLGLYDEKHLFNYAVGGFSTNDFPMIIDYMAKNHTFDPTGLYVIEVGQNDLLHELNATEDIVDRIIDTTQTLYNLGARHFMVVGSIHFGMLPEIITLNDFAINYFNDYTITFNRLLLEKINTLAFAEQVSFYDLGSVLENGANDANRYGIFNTFDSCIQTLCANPKEYLWLDALHLSGSAHQAIGNSMYDFMAPRAPKN